MGGWAGACQPRGRRVVSGRNEAVAQHNLGQPRRIRSARTVHSLRDLLEKGPADRTRVQDEKRTRRLRAEILVVMDGAAGNQHRFAGPNLALVAIDRGRQCTRQAEDDLVDLAMAMRAARKPASLHELTVGRTARGDHFCATAADDRHFRDPRQP